jgi:hypothetical protein
VVHQRATQEGEHRVPLSVGSQTWQRS